MRRPCDLYWPDEPKNPAMYYKLDLDYVISAIGTGEDLELDAIVWFDASDVEDSNPDPAYVSWSPRVPLCESVIERIEHAAKICLAARILKWKRHPRQPEEGD